MPDFKWIEYNRRKIDGHGLTEHDVEYAYAHASDVFHGDRPGSYESVGRTPGGRTIRIVWRYDALWDPSDPWSDEPPIFVVTAY